MNQSPLRVAVGRIAVAFSAWMFTSCATGTKIQTECEQASSSFPDLVACTKSGVAARVPDRLNDPKSKLYMLRGEVLAQDVKTGLKTDAEARLEWQKLYVELWEPSPQEKAARIQMLGQMLQQQSRQNLSPGYQIVQSTPLAASPALANMVTAFWTGRSQPATSVTGQAGMSCEYQYAGTKFWRMFSGYCPPSVEAR